MDVENVISSWLAMCLWAQIEFDIPIGFDGMTRKYRKKNCDSGPNHKNEANHPGGNSKLEIDIKNAIQEQ